VRWDHSLDTVLYNAVKTWFVVKPAHLAAAKRLSAGTGVNISVEG